MNSCYKSRKTIILTVFLSSLNVNFLLPSIFASANPLLLELAQIFQPPKGDKPDNTSGAGSRNDKQCPIDLATNTSSNSLKQSPPLIALAPSDSVGLTVSEKPRFWVYIPPTSAKSAVLSLQTPEKTYLIQTSVSLSGTGEIVGLTLSKDTPPLEIGKIYQWVVVLVCGDRPSPNDPVVKASVRRVALPESNPLPSNSQAELTQAIWYGKHGIWYDTLNTLIQAKQKQPSNPEIESAWLDLLQSVGLEQISTEEVR